MQIWFKSGDILVNDIPIPKEKYIKSIGFLIILHAAFKSEDFGIYGEQLLELTQYFGNDEAIVRPVWGKTLIVHNTEYELAKQTCLFSKNAQNKGITWKTIA